MRELYELKEMLCKELEEYGRKGEMSAGSLEIIDKLAHAIKNICKIIEAYEEEEEYSGNYGGGSYAGGQGGNQGGGNYSRARGGSRYSRTGGSYRGGSSYARGRGRNARRDSMGRYSREGGYSMGADGVEEMVQSIREMMQDLPQEVQMDAQRFVQKLEQQM